MSHDCYVIDSCNPNNLQFIFMCFGIMQIFTFHSIIFICFSLFLFFFSISMFWIPLFQKSPKQMSLASVGQQQNPKGVESFSPWLPFTCFCIVMVYVLYVLWFFVRCRHGSCLHNVFQHLLLKVLSRAQFYVIQQHDPETQDIISLFMSKTLFLMLMSKPSGI